MVRFNRAVVIVVASLLISAGIVGLSFAADDAPAPATTTATTTPSPASSKPAQIKPAQITPADIAPDAKPILEKLADAYKNLKSLDVAGALSGDFDVDGQKSQEQLEFTGSFAAPNQFRHAMKQSLTAGSTGEQLFVFEPQRKLYKTAEAKKEKVRSSELPPPFDRILLDQNLSLLLALSSDPAAELGDIYPKIAKAADVTIDDKPHPALALSNEHETMTLALDPQTNLVRRATLDLSHSLKKRGAQDVTKALLTMDYATSTPGAATKPEQFAWAPPAGARDVATIQTALGDDANPAIAIEGKPAPDFKLKDLAGKKVAFADLKGNVLVLDFWATWCPPCVEAMPGLNELAGEKKADGVKVIAINADEEGELVSGFINSRKLSNLMVLLDPELKVAAEYKADERWPTTMVVGKDGTVRRVIRTLGSEGERELKTAVEEALKASK